MSRIPPHRPSHTAGDLRRPSARMHYQYERHDGALSQRSTHHTMQNSSPISFPNLADNYNYIEVVTYLALRASEVKGQRQVIKASLPPEFLHSEQEHSTCSFLLLNFHFSEHPLQRLESLRPACIYQCSFRSYLSLPVLLLVKRRVKHTETTGSSALRMTAVKRRFAMAYS